MARGRGLNAGVSWNDVFCKGLKLSMWPFNKVAILLLIFCLFPQVLFGQENFNSVRKQAMRSGSRQKAIKILVEFADSESTSSIEQIRAFDFLARFCARQGNLPKADEFVNRAKNLAEKETDRRLLRNVLQIESAIANQLSEYDRGIRAATRCIEISESVSPNDPYIAKPLNERAINYTCANQLDLAVNDYQRALLIADHRGDDKLRMHLLGNIASVFDELKLHEKSIEKNLQALVLANKFENQRCIARISVNLANSFLALDQISESRNYFEFANEAALSVEDHSVIGMVSTGLGDLDALENRFDDARGHYERAQKAFKKVDDSVGVLQVQARIFKLNTIQEKHVADNKTQIQELQELLTASEREQKHHLSIDIVDQLVEKHRQQENWQSVAELLNKKVAFREQIWSDSNRAAIERLDNSKQELAEKQSHILMLVVATSGLMLITMALLFIWRGKHLATKQLQESNVKLRWGQQQRTILERRLAEQQKVDSLSTMSAGLLHDFNNYLMAIISAAETGQLISDEKQKNKLFESVLRTGLSASELTKSLSDYLGQGQLSNSVCQVDETIQDGLNVWREIAGGDVSIEYEPNDVVAWIGMDHAQLNQIISNVVKNSSEAISQTGIIRIRLSKLDVDELTKTLSVSSAQETVESDTEYCQISITDDGIGMTPQGVVRALDPYFSTKGIGRGLGLASANGIIERHDGKLIVQSQPGVGTEVSIVLPISSRALEENTTVFDRNNKSECLVDLAELRILLVEDEQSVGEGVQHYLQTHGIYVVLVHSVSDAFEFLDSESFDCVITDYMLPGLTGKDLAQWIRQTDADLPIILISAYAADNIFETDLFDSFLAKPFPLHQLLNSIHNVVAAKLPANSSPA